MGFFKSKDEKAEELMEKLELKGLSERDYELLNMAVKEHGVATNFSAMAITSKSDEQAKIHLQATIAYQNWFIIRQLNQLNEKLNKLLEK